MSVHAQALLRDTQALHIPASPQNVRFMAHRSGGYLAVVGPVRYWLTTMSKINEEIEVSLTAEAADDRRQISRWVQASLAHDKAHARRLVQRHHGRMHALAVIFGPVPQCRKADVI